jgi:nitroimidazol reductase NimA-like FMN-containing flavoprotein (pyridoxamine 5'-phosphate oxidase superfamily)
MRVVPHLHELSRHEALRLLADARLGRVALSVDALPVVLPVFVAMVDDRIVFRTVPGTKLTAAVNETIVAVEADRLDEHTGEGWSVLVRGIARELTDPVATDLARTRLGSTWLDGAAEHLVEVTTDLVTGRRLA